MIANESRPAGNEAASQTPEQFQFTPPERRTGSYWFGYLDGRAHGVEVGFERGFRARVEMEAEQRARELLKEQADTFGAWAQAEAERRYGTAWAAMFGEAS